MKVRTVVAVTALVGLVISACGGTPAASPTTSTAASASGAAASPAGSGAATGAPYEINVILALTGGASFLGKPEQAALQALETQVNAQGGIQGRPVKFTFYDDESKPQTDVQLANQIKAKNVPVILGPSLVASCNAIIPIIKDGPVMYCFSPGIHPDKGTYAFTSSVSTIDLSRALFAYFKDKGMTKIATLTSTDATGQDADNAIKAGQTSAGGITIVDQEHFNPTDVSVSAQITHIKGSGAQALVAWSTGAPVATILRGAAQEGLDIPIATTNGNQTFGQMTQYASFLPKELLIPSAEFPAYDTLPAGPLKDKLKSYLDALKAANVPPDNGPSLAWDPAVIVIDMLRKLGPSATATQLRDAIEGLKGYTGIDGTYDFSASPQRGLGVSNAIVTRWDASKKAWVPVSTP